MQCSRNKCTKALYSSKMTPSVLFSISFLMIPNIFLALLTATEHWADYFRKLTDRFPEMRLPILSSASQTQFRLFLLHVLPYIHLRCSSFANFLLLCSILWDSSDIPHYLFGIWLPGAAYSTADMVITWCTALSRSVL